MLITDNAMQLLQKGYFQDGETSWDDIARRVSKAISYAENDDNKSTYENEFYDAISKMDFIPSTPCLINAGGRNQQLSSCFIIPIKDSIESILQATLEMTKIFQLNGGCGLNISSLRPNKSIVEGAGGASNGPISFMQMFDLTADIMTRNNLRKGALKIDMCDWHPDILDFISCKDDTTKFTRMNISVSACDKFMMAIENDDNWNLMFPDYSKCKDIYDTEWDGDIWNWINKSYPVKIYQTVKAKDLYRKIMEHAWKTGEPGISFIDTMDRGNPNPHIDKVSGSNPCSEFVSIPYTSCNLASINLPNMIEDGALDKNKLSKTIATAVRFLDNMIDVNKLPTSDISEMTRQVRSIGLGYMGFADVLYSLGIRYGSKECISFIDDICKFIYDCAEYNSCKLAQERGVYDAWAGSTWHENNKNIRNSNLISIAPNGSLGIISNSNGGIEPCFALCYTRRMHDDTIFNVINPIFESTLRQKNLYSESLIQKVIENNGSCQGIKEMPKDIQNVFVIASDVTPQEHLEVLANIQKYVDNSVSKTINLPNNAKVEDIEYIYRDAWIKNVKGVAVYRDGSRANQTLSVGKENKSNTEEKIEVSRQLNSIVPLPRSDFGKTIGTTAKYKTACGSMYVTINKSNNGDIVEIFANVSKNGMCNSNISGICRMISLNLRTGTVVEEVIDQLKGINCAACSRAIAKGEKLDGISCPDLISRAIQDEYNNKEIYVAKTKKRRQQSTNNMGFTECPECGEKTLRAEGGCFTCSNCSYSKCG